MGLLVIAIAAPPVTEIPLTIDAPVAEVPDTPVIALVLIVTVVPLDELIAVTVFPALDKVPMVLLDMDFVGDAEELIIPVTAPVVEERPVIVFELVLLVSVVAGCELVNPITGPPAPEDVKVVMLFEFTFNVVALP